MEKRMIGNSSSSKQNKSKNGIDCQLPKINKSFFEELSEPMSLKFHWLTVNKDYSSASSHELEHQYNTLRKQLINLNELVVKNIEKMSLNKSYVKKKIPGQVEKAVQVSERQIQNNNSIITRLRYQHEQLQKRVSFLEENNKDQLSSVIQQTKNKINIMRLKNKDIQKKSKEIGNNIQNGDDCFNEIKQLQIQKDLLERKRMRLRDKTTEVSNNLLKVAKNASLIDGGAQEAVKYIEEELHQYKAEQVQKQIKTTYKNKAKDVEILMKNKQTLNNIKQQRYHQSLKQLENLNRNIEQHIKTIHVHEQKDIALKKQKQELQQRLQQLKTMRKSQDSDLLFYTQIVQFQQKSSEASNKQPFNRIGKIRHNKMDQKNSISKLQNNTITDKIGHQLNKIKIAQRIKENKTQVLRGNLSSSRNKNKLTKTEAIQIQKDERTDKNRYNTSIFNKKITTDKKQIQIKKQSQNTDQSKELHVPMPNKSKFNTIQLTNKPEIIKRTLDIKSNSKLFVEKVAETKRQKQNKPQQMKESKIIQQIQKFDEQNNKSMDFDYNNKSKIKEQIQSSGLSQFSDFNQKESNTKNKEQKQMQKRLGKEDEVIIQTSKKDEQEQDKHGQGQHKQQQEENDIDLKEFKQSINAERQSLNLDKHQINIALGEIQNTIKRNEMQSKLRKYSPKKSISQEEESFS